MPLWVLILIGLLAAVVGNMLDAPLNKRARWWGRANQDDQPSPRRKRRTEKRD